MGFRDAEEFVNEQNSDHPPVPKDMRGFCVIGIPCIHVRGDHFISDPEIVARYLRIEWLNIAEESIATHGIGAKQTLEAFGNAEAWKKWAEERR